MEFGLSLLLNLSLSSTVKLPRTVLKLDNSELFPKFNEHQDRSVDALSSLEHFLVLSVLLLDEAYELVLAQIYFLLTFYLGKVE